jgi:hypothetical protein
VRHSNDGSHPYCLGFLNTGRESLGDRLIIQFEMLWAVRESNHECRERCAKQHGARCPDAVTHAAINNKPRPRTVRRCATRCRLVSGACVAGGDP